MYVESLEIKNFRGIDHSQITFQKGFNIIKGENGKGKTSIIEALAVALGGFIAGFSGVSTRHFAKEDIRKEIKLIGDGSCTETYKTPIEVSVSAVIHGRKEIWTRSRASLKSSRTTTTPKAIIKLAEEMELDENSELPVIVLQSASRVWNQKKEKTQNVFKTKYSRTTGYMDALEDASNIKLLLNWCVKMEQVSWQKGKAIAEYEAVKKAVADFMSYINGKNNYQVFYDKQLEELVYSVDGCVKTVNSLSAGYQSLIWMVFDIAYRMAVLNPENKLQIAEGQGIVLIDEIDMHLHPKWQWNIVDALRKVFPNIQFIATTHAPILFASAKNVWLIDVEQDEPKYSYSHYGIDINTAVKSFQDTSEVPLSIKKRIDKFYDAMDAGKYEEAREILLAVESETEPAFASVVQMRTRYEFETMISNDEKPEYLGIVNWYINKQIKRRK